jgi:EAL and modified HD-GYP domain-containing signal transduction protein
MSASPFLLREPLLDPSRKVIAHELRWQTGSQSGDDEALGLLIAAELHRGDEGWLLADGKLILPVSPAFLEGAASHMLPGASFTLTLEEGADIAPEALAAARSAGYRVALRGLSAPPELLPLLSGFELDGAASDLALQLKTALRQRAADARIAVRNIAAWKHYDVCAAAGLDVYAGKLLDAPAPAQASRGLNPSQTVILQLMNLVGKNADVRELEGVLKRDAAISYKLFRYINSVGFGLGTEITSLRHAVSMLGYNTLYRWLSLLLATASTGAHAAALMQTAIIRGRITELLGHYLLPKSDAENLFVAGMFSLLDRLLGITMEEVLTQIQLSEALSQALLKRAGIYGPFLALAESCERADGDSQAFADALFLSAEQVNAAHLAALAWAQNLKL